MGLLIPLPCLGINDININGKSNEDFSIAKMIQSLSCALIESRRRNSEDIAGTPSLYDWTA
jgi:hypothetical protein